MKDKNNTKVVLSKWVEVEGQPKQLFEEIDHPCKDTCSGWAMGYEKGASMVDHKMSAIILAEQNQKLMRQNKLMKEILEHIADTVMPELGDYGFEGEELARHYEDVALEVLQKVKNLD